MVARYGVHGVNDSGERLIEMCTGQELAIGKTFFKKKKKNKYTWARVVNPMNPGPDEIFMAKTLGRRPKPAKLQHAIIAILHLCVAIAI